MLSSYIVRCPHCGEEIELEVDPTAGRRQQFVEDCWVCCRPIEFSLNLDAAGEATVIARKDY